MSKKLSDRLNQLIESHRWRKRNKRSGCWSHVIRAYMAHDERETVQRLFREHGIKYTKEKRRLRVAYKIPWGVDFDVRNPASCPKAGAGNPAAEVLMAVLESEHQAKTGGRVKMRVGNDPTCKHEETTPWEKASFGFVPTYVANC